MNPSKTGLNVLLIRHAESSNNVLNEIYEKEEYNSIREADPDLSELGELQATYLGSHIAAHPSLYNVSYSNFHLSLLQRDDPCSQNSRFHR